VLAFLSETFPKLVVRILGRNLVGTPNPKYYLRTRMIIDDGGYPTPLRDWALAYVFGFNLYELLVEVY